MLPLQRLNVGKEVMEYRNKFLGSATPRSGPNHRSVTVKQVKLACASKKHEGRFVLDNSQLYTVRLCGLIVHIDQDESHTDFIIFDGTGALDGRIWSTTSDGRTDLSGGKLDAYYVVVCHVLMHDQKIYLQALSAREVADHNIITMHMLQAIHDVRLLSSLNRADLEKWTDAQREADKVMKTTMSMELDKEAIVGLLSSAKIRESEAGAHWTYVITELHMTREEGWAALRSMLDEGSVYNTTDYNHFKLADEK